MATVKEIMDFFTNDTNSETEATLTLEEALSLTDLNILLWAIQLGASTLIMGSECSHANFTWQFRHPGGVWLGVAIVELLMPFTGFVLARVFRLDTPDAISLIILSNCPSDGLSAVFSYWTDSDVCLSLSITFFSIAMSVGLIPLGITFYSGDHPELSLTIIPYEEVVVLIGIMTVGLSCGLLIRRANEKWADRFAKFASPIPLLITIALVVVNLVFTPDPYEGTTWIEWVAASLVSFCGLVYGYALGLLTNQPAVARRAIALSSANKSILLAAYTIVNSFEKDTILGAFPLLGISQITFVTQGLFFVMVYRCVVCYYA